VYPLNIVLPLAVFRLREFCVRKFQLHRKPPNLYCLINRQGWRSIANMGTILEKYKEGLPQYPWVIEKYATSFTSSAALFDRMRVFFTPHGGGMTNLIFMQKKTLFIDIEGQQLGLWYVNMSVLLEIHCIFARMVKMQHSTDRTTEMSARLIEELVKETGLQLMAMDSADKSKVNP
jgi:hypothetical protein